MYIPYNEQNACIKVGAVIKCDKRMINCTSVRSSTSGNGVVWASTHGGNKVGRYGHWGTTESNISLIRTYLLRR